MICNFYEICCFLESKINVILKGKNCFGNWIYKFFSICMNVLVDLICDYFFMYKVCYFIFCIIIN